MKKTTWIVRTAVCLALLLVLQVATKSLGQFVTGSCVNLVLAMAALSGGLWSGVAVAVLSPFCAYALGIGPAFLQLVPCVALGNAVYAVLFALLVGKWLTAKPLAAWGSMVLAAARRFGTKRPRVRILTLRPIRLKSDDFSRIFCARGKIRDK